MISEFIERLKNWIRAKIEAAAEAVRPEVTVVPRKTVLVSSEGNGYGETVQVDERPLPSLLALYVLWFTSVISGPVFWPF